jgi:predicted NAD/FAD-dependent oxidoreductase
MDDELVAGVSAELPQWFGAERTWKHLRTYRIPDSLPKFAAGSGAVVSPKVADGVFLCGDYTAYPSLNGAMRSGREVAEMIGA